MTILIPSPGPESWKAFLADEAHWRSGYSAKSLAYCWSEAAGLPREVAGVLDTAPLFAQREVLLAIPEHQVALPGGGRPSQTDLWLLLRTPAALASVAVEGKVNEPFGPTVGEWYGEGTPNRDQRLAGLREILGLQDVPHALRYQLLHRTASAILEARRFLAAHAVMLVHSFSQSDMWFDDFAALVELLGGTAEKGRLIAIPDRSGPTLHVGWVRGDAQYLTR